MTSKQARQAPRLLRNQFKYDNAFGIPIIKKCEIKNKNLKFIGFDQVDNKKRGLVNRTIHFFIDDNKFDKVYNSPKKYYKMLAKFEAVLTPDFSLFTDMPLVIQMYNVFKNRWCGAYRQDLGLKTVIPTISWGDERSYDFSFLVVEKGSTVAISTVGVRKKKEVFMKGYKAMREIIKPQLIYCYGKPFSEMNGEIIFIEYLSKAGRC